MLGLEDAGLPPDEAPVEVDHPQEAQQLGASGQLGYMVMASTLAGSSQMPL